MSKEKRVSIRKFEEVAAERFPNVEEIDWYGNAVVIKKALSLREVVSFVNDIVDSCFVDDTYHPEFMDFAIKGGILEHYTNFALPTNSEKLYDLIYGTDVIEVVMGYVHGQQLEEIIASANRKIRYVCDAQISDTQVKLKELSEQFGQIADSLGGVFGELKSADIKALAGAVSNGKIDEGKIADAFIRQMRNSEKE